ncbi:hypothetical protein Avbf_11473 [Armadillidium vulgare]|nr:hypothetical protein Avbf_11473 [Armadillidium vulgare]
MVFDTTSYNTRQHTAACVCLQRELDRPLLWFACRRHVGEVMLSDCWDSLNIEASSGPNISIFTRFKNHYLQLLSVNKAAYYYPELPRATEKEQESLANCFREFLASTTQVPVSYQIFFWLVKTSAVEVTMLNVTAPIQSTRVLSILPG